MPPLLPCVLPACSEIPRESPRYKRQRRGTWSAIGHRGSRPPTSEGSDVPQREGDQSQLRGGLGEVGLEAQTVDSRRIAQGEPRSAGRTPDTLAEGTMVSGVADLLENEPLAIVLGLLGANRG